MKADFYGLLGVPRDAPPEEVKRAFREKAREFHPDLNDDQRADAQFKTVRKAYEVLSNPDERQAYDRMGHETYVARRLKGLPTMGVETGDDAAGRSQTGRRAETGTGTGNGRTGSERSERTRTRTGTAGGSSGEADASGRRTGRQDADARYGRTYRQRARVDDEVDRRIDPFVPLAAVVAAAYVIGLSQFVATNWAAFEAVVVALRAGELESGVNVALIPGTGTVEPIAFARATLTASSVGLLFPLGALLFPLPFLLALRRVRRPSAWLALGGACAPLCGFGAAATTPGIGATVFLNALLFALVPALALGWLTVTAYRRAARRP